MSVDVVKNISDSCEALGGIDLGGIKLEDASPRLLDVSEMDLDKHVAIQPAAIAFYGFLKKQALRRLTTLRRGFERWQKKKYAEAKASLGHGSGKSTVADIEARYIVDNEPEIEKWEQQLDKAQLEFDTLDCWYEAWRQKSFSIREHADIDSDERYSSPHLSSNNSNVTVQRPILTPATGAKHIRSIIQKRREQLSGEQTAQG